MIFSCIISDDKHDFYLTGKKKYLPELNIKKWHKLLQKKPYLLKRDCC